MNQLDFNAFVVSEKNDKFISEIKSIKQPKLEDGKVLISVKYSSLNYKDALSASGNRGVTREYPFVPGIDAAGTVIESSCDKLCKGDEVIVTGYDLGMNTFGGFGEVIHVPTEWVVNLPNNLSLEDSMMLGTAGLTAAACIDSILMNDNFLKPVAVSGASGGVGSIAVSILSKLHISATAISSKKESEDFLKGLGAENVIFLDDYCKNDCRPLDKSVFSNAIDAVGGEILSRLISQVERHGVITCCGNVNSHILNTTVFPFILRGITLKGIDSAESSIDYKSYLWSKLASEWKVDLHKSTKMIALDELSLEIDKILAGKQIGRVLIKHNI